MVGEGAIGAPLSKLMGRRGSSGCWVRCGGGGPCGPGGRPSATLPVELGLRRCGNGGSSPGSLFTRGSRGAYGAYGGCAGEGREASKQASKRASDVEKKGRQGGRWLSPMLWDRRRGLHNGRRREVLCPLGTARSNCTTVHAADTGRYVPG